MRYVPLSDYGLVTVGPLSTRPLLPLVLSFIRTSPSHCPSLATADANKNLDDVKCILRHGTLKNLSNSILEPHHIDALLMLSNPIAFAFALSFFSRYVLLYYHCHLHILFNLTVWQQRRLAIK